MGTRAAGEYLHMQPFRVLPDRNTEYMFSISFGKHRDEKKEINLLTLILFPRAIIASKVRATSVSPSSYRNTNFNQSTCIFSWDCFLINELTSVFHAPVLLLIMNFVITLLKLKLATIFFTITNCQMSAIAR